MEIYKNIQSLNKSINEIKKQNLSIGFVPTMGALHEGHLSLITQSQKENDYTVISIFVNPLQFNNPDDLENYPRTIDEDIDKINSLQSKNFILYLPVHKELFPVNDSFKLIDLNGMDKVMEGEFRPGHFNGVVHVVHNLFKHVRPNRAYFGKKDFQQLAIIKFITKKYHFEIDIKSCQTKRDDKGLALSSRNKLLNEKEKNLALVIYKALKTIRSLKESSTPENAIKKATEFFKTSPIKIEYISIIDGNTLKKSNTWGEYPVCCIAAHCKNVRLIDCMEI